MASFSPKEYPGALNGPKWSEIVKYLEGHYPHLLKGWFAQLAPGHLQHGVLEIQAATRPQLDYLQQHCSTAFAQAAQQLTGHLVSVNFTCAQPDAAPSPGPTGRRPLSFESEPLHLNTEYTFDNFVVGRCNRLAHAASIAISQSPGRSYNPLFIHGAVGLGKTHLLQAVSRAILASHEPARILYLTGEDFTNHFLEAVEHSALHGFRYRYRHADVLVIDDIQFLAERERSQEEFFHTFNTLYQDHKQIVLASDAPPNEIPTLEDRLISRFNWGLVTGIDKPCLETRMAIVRKKARLRCIELPDDVVQLVASRVDSNTRELEGVITKLDLLSRSFGGVIDLGLAAQALGDLPERQQPMVTIPQIMQVVANHYGVRTTDLQGKRRTKSVAFPRQVAMHLARELTACSLEEIGGYFGGRDHTTVLHATRTITAAAESDTTLTRELAHLQATLHRRNGH